MRAFLDANVLFSASNSGSHIARLVRLLCDRGAAVSSDLAVEEARRNIALKRSAWLRAFEDLVRSLEIVPSTRFVLPVELQAKDAPLLCAAIRSRCEYFVTGDKRDFGHLLGHSVAGVQIVSLLRLAELLVEEHR